jgi:hypothetical protein
MMVLPAIRIDAFLSKKRTAPLTGVNEVGKRTKAAPASDQEPFFELRVPKHNLVGKAVLRDGEVVILKGSTARRQWIGNRAHTASSAQRHDDLVESGIIDISHEPAVFTADYAFQSPSSAADVITGRATNGRTSWIHSETGQTYAEWEEAQLKKDMP